MERQAVMDWPAAESREEDSLVGAARDGDRAAFGRLYDRYARMVHGILRVTSLEPTVTGVTTALLLISR